MAYRNKTKDIKYKKTMKDFEAVLFYMEKTKIKQKVFSFISAFFQESCFIILMLVPFAGWFLAGKEIWDNLVHNGRQIELSSSDLKPIVSSDAVGLFFLGTLFSGLTIIALICML